MVEILNKISFWIGIIGIGVIVYGVILMLFRLVRLELRRFKRGTIFHEREAVRHQLGSYLLLGLEFLIAADIISTITHPTLKDIAILGSIVVIRTIISFFVDKELAVFEPPNSKKE